jgi:hypothetical protein
MDRVGAAGPHAGKVEPFQDVQDLDEVDAARTRRGHRDDRVAAIGAPHGLPHHGTIGGQILGRHHPAGRTHGLRDALRDDARVEGVRAGFRDRRQRVGQIGLDQPIAALQGTIAGKEDLSRGGPAPEQAGGARQGIGEARFHGNAVARQCLGRGDEFGEGEAARTVEAVRLGQPPHGAGHPHRLAAAGGGRAVGLAVRVEEHIGAGGGRRGLAVIEGDDLLALRAVDHHEAAAAEVARAGQGHGEREPHRYGGVDRIAAGLQDRDADLRGARLLRRDHAVSTEHRQQARIVGLDRGQLGQSLREARPRRGEDQGEGSPHGNEPHVRRVRYRCGRACPNGGRQSANRPDPRPRP